MSETSLKPIAPAAFRFFAMKDSARLVLSGGLFALGTFLQIAAGTLIGSFVILLGWIPLLLRRVTNKPKDQGLEDWRPVSSAEVDRLLDTFAQAVRIRGRLGAQTALRVLCFVFIALIAVGALITYGAAGLVALDAALFLIPALFFGRVRVFTPGLISQKLRSFKAVLAEPLPTGFLLTPYMRFDKDEEGRDVPEDLRFLLEPRKKAEDLIGIQFQVAVNSGPQGPVPYLYAVILTRGRDGLVYRSLHVFSSRGYEVERGGNDEYGTVVIRQKTGGTGYHTKPEDCRRLFRVAVDAVSGF